MKKSFFIQSVSVFATKIFMLVSGFLVYLIYARTLGPEGFGVISIALATLMIVISIADFGIRQAITFGIGKKTLKKDNIASTILSLMSLSVPFSILLTVIYYHFIYTDGDKMILLLICLILPINIFVVYTRGVSLAEEMLSEFNKVDLYQRFSYLLLVIVFYLVFTLEKEYWGILAYLIGVIASFIISVRVIKKFNAERIKLQVKAILPLIKTGVLYAITLAVINFNYKTGLYVLEYVGTKEMVGVYAVGTKIAELVWQVTAAAGVVLFMKSATSVKEKEAIIRTTRLLRILLPIVGIICIILFLIANWIIPFLFGDGYIESIILTKILIPGIFFAVIFKVLYPDVAGRGYPEFGLIIFLSIGVLNIIMAVILFNWMGMHGVALSTTISYIIGSIVFLMFYSFKYNVKINSLLILNYEDYLLVRKNIKSLFANKNIN